MRSRHFLAISLVGSAFLGGCDPATGGSGSTPLPFPVVEGEGGSTSPTTTDTTDATTGTTDTTSVGGGGSTSDGGGGSTTDGGGGSGEGGMATGGSGQGACDGGGPVIEDAGSNTKYLLKGTLLLPAGPMEGELYISGNIIQCVGASCAAQATGATVIETNGVISPGLIDGHNHILYDVFDETDWSPIKNYTNHNQWPNEAKYGEMGDCKRYLAGEAGSPVNYSCEMLKYAETKALIAGTTSVQGQPGSQQRACYGNGPRTLGIIYNDLPSDKMRTTVGFPTESSANGVCADFADGKTNAYVIHIGEGTDASAGNEFGKLGTVTTVDNCLYAPQTTIVHGVAITDAQYDLMGDNGMSLVWSPQSNVFLYGNKTDLTKTADIPYALNAGINVSLGPDWSMGGSQNMLDEMRFADKVDNQTWGDTLTPKDLWQMATVNSAKAMHIDQYVGTLEQGKRADIAVFLPSGADPYRAVLDATPTDVTMVFVDGRFLYGDVDLKGQGPPSSTCETIDVCCRSKFVCLAETNGPAADKLGQTLAQVVTILNDATEIYDQQAATSFAPITPLVKCQ